MLLLVQYSAAGRPPVLPREGLEPTDGGPVWRRSLSSWVLVSVLMLMLVLVMVMMMML